MTGTMPDTWPGARHSFPAEDLDAFLAWAADRGASDISFQTGAPAMIEIDGRLLAVSATALDSVVMGRLVEVIFDGSGESILRSGQAIDCSYAIHRPLGGPCRWRCNLSAVLVAGAFAVNITMRTLPDEIPSLDDLGIEAEIAAAWETSHGLTLVTGVPGSGKSTLLAAGTRRLIERGAGRVQSIEAPIEFVFDGIAAQGALMSSSEVPRHFPTFAEALRASLRRRPAAVIVGEARDRETVEAVVRAADYGIAVYSTTHTIGVAATIRRMLAEFGHEERAERGAALLDVMNLVVTQCLLPSPQGGRTAIREWLTFGQDLKADLLGRPLETWPAEIAAEVGKTGNTLAGAAWAAWRAGTIEHADLVRFMPLAEPALEDAA